MIDYPGKKRVIINNVLPSVDRGQYPAKAIVNTPLTISADIFSDGHDKISAVLQIRHSSSKQWEELELIAKGNDRWETIYTPSKLGSYFFQLKGWINHYSTWQDAINKKYNAGQEIAVDLKAGALIIREATDRASGKKKEQLIKWANKLETVTDKEKGMEIVRNESIDALLMKHPDKNKVTEHPHTFEITVEQPKAGFSTWYELFPRSASTEPDKHGDFNDVIRLLPRIEKMGFDVLYLPPIHPIGYTHRKGRNNSLIALPDDPGSPWAIGSNEGGHKDIHPQLGTLKDFKQLLETAKNHGIDIAMDIAFQCSPDHPYVKKHPQWFKWRADGTVQFAENPPKKYEDIIPFDFESDDWQGLWKELKSVIKYWADQGVSIFRVDNPHTKAIRFWEWVIKDLKKEYPQLIFLAEAFTRPRIMEKLAKVGFTQSYTYFTWRNNKWELEQYLNELTKTELQYYFRPNFWPNTPDILPPELTNGRENAHIMRLIIAATMSSNYGLYGPVYEFGLHEPMPGKEEYIHNEKYEIKNWDWDAYTRIKEIIIRINRIRKENPALQTTNNIEFAHSDNDKIICYVKADAQKKNVLIMVVNLDPYATQYANITIPSEKLGLNPEESFKVHDLLSGDKYEWQGQRHFVALNPYDLPAHILKLSAKPVAL